MEEATDIGSWAVTQYSMIQIPYVLPKSVEIGLVRGSQTIFLHELVVGGVRTEIRKRDKNK